MYVIVDIVLNHTADIFRYTQDDAPYRKEGQYEFKEWHKISKSEELTEQRPTELLLFLAMARWRCGKHEDALKAYQPAESMEDFLKPRDYIRTLRDEAAALLGLQETPHTETPRRPE